MPWIERRVKIAMRVALALGAAVAIGLLAREGFANVVGVLSRAGLVLLWLVPLHVLPLVLDVLGWQELMPGRARFSMLLRIAAVREAVNRLLPVANVGGEVVGIRLLVLTGVDGIVAAAGIVVEVLLTLVSQYLFVVLGVLLLVRATTAGRVTPTVLLGLAAGLPVIGLIAVVVRHGALFERLQRFAVHVLGPSAAAAVGRGAELDAAIRRSLSRHRALALAVAWQFVGLVAGCLETWLALRWLGAPVDFGTALVLESLTQAARHFVFVVPLGLGVQEAGLLGLGHLLGLPSDAALALSLAKRMRELLFGLPALIGWQWVEGKRSLAQARSRH